jgi:hypothetical protein
LSTVIVVVVSALFTVWAAPAEAGLALKLLSPAYVAVRVLLPAELKVMLHVPLPMLPVQLFVPSLTVTLPVGAVGVLPVLDVTLKLTATGCPVTDGSGVSVLIEVVVFALLIVMLAVPDALSTVASALPAPAAEAVKVAVAVPFD